ncbi:MAG: hypothetical protein ACKVTZ_17750 [Bacteroidia bacterium]
MDKQTILAQYGSDVLLRNAVVEVVPEGMSSEDSASFVKQYVNEWLTERAVAEEAEKKVPNLEEQVAAELKNIRAAIVRKAYAEWLSNQIDTLVNEGDMQSYYESHKEKFTSTANYYLYFYVKIKGTQAPQLVSQLSSNNPEEIEKLKKWCSENAATFRLDSNFVEEAVLKDISQGYYGDLSHAKINTVHTYRFIDANKQIYTNYFRLLKIIKPNEVLPYSACKERIRDAILLQRKNEMIQVSEQNVLKKAQKEGKTTVSKQ